MIIKGKEIKPNKLNKIGGEIPFYVMSSNKPGPTILLSGGLHGCLLYTSPSPRD